MPDDKPTPSEQLEFDIEDEIDYNEQVSLFKTELLAFLENGKWKDRFGSSVAGPLITAAWIAMAEKGDPLQATLGLMAYVGNIAQNNAIDRSMSNGIGGVLDIDYPYLHDKRKLN